MGRGEVRWGRMALGFVAATWGGVGTGRGVVPYDGWSVGRIVGGAPCRWGWSNMGRVIMCRGGSGNGERLAVVGWCALGVACAHLHGVEESWQRGSDWFVGFG